MGYNYVLNMYSKPQGIRGARLYTEYGIIIVLSGILRVRRNSITMQL